MDQRVAKYDVVIPYKMKGNSDELRMALRTIDSNFLSVRDVYIVGECPSWVENVIHIPSPQNDHKRVNVGKAYREALAQKDLSEEFILWNDDMFILQPMREIPSWHGGPLRDFIKLYSNTYPTGYYTEMARSTGHHIDGDLPHWELHIPVKFNKTKLKELMGPEISPRGLLLRTLYGSAYGVSKSSFHEDVKIHSYSGSKGWYERDRFKEFVSSADNTYLGVIYPRLIRLYPDRSRYEKPW